MLAITIEYTLMTTAKADDAATLVYDLFVYTAICPLDIVRMIPRAGQCCCQYSTAMHHKSMITE